MINGHHYVSISFLFHLFIYSIFFSLILKPAGFVFPTFFFLVASGWQWSIGRRRIDRWIQKGKTCSETWSKTFHHCPLCVRVSRLQTLFVTSSIIVGNITRVSFYHHIDHRTSHWSSCLLLRRLLLLLHLLFHVIIPYYYYCIGIHCIHHQFACEWMTLDIHFQTLKYKVKSESTNHLYKIILKLFRYYL